MRVLADFHHQALYHSLQLLFENRLGWELYRPIGPEWHEQGYWHVYEHPATVKQFLGLYQGMKEPLLDGEGVPWTERELVNKNYIIEDGIYYIQDNCHRTTHRAVTLDKFKEMEFDILLSSIPQHIQPYNKLITEFQPKAKHIFQVGNQWGNLPGAKNIMASTTPFQSAANTIFYHQEFDLNVFKYEAPTNHNTICSYVHYLQQPEKLQQLVSLLPGWSGIPYGGGMPQSLPNQDAVAEALKNSAFTWHFKPGGDGFGHSIFSSYACGRPALIWRPHYTGRKADPLFIDQQTCIDSNSYSSHKLAQLLQKFSQPEEHIKMCEAAYRRFCQIVNFDQEFEQIKLFLERLQ